MKRGMLAVGIAAVLGLAGRSSAGAANEGPIFMPCVSRHVPEPQPKKHPKNCVFTTGANDSVTLHDYQEIRWTHWGSPMAEGVAISIDPETHERQRRRFAVSGKQTCEEKTYYGKFLLKRPHFLNPNRVTSVISCPESPGEFEP